MSIFERARQSFQTPAKDAERKQEKGRNVAIESMRQRAVRQEAQEEESAEPPAAPPAPVSKRGR